MDDFDGICMDYYPKAERRHRLDVGTGDTGFLPDGRAPWSPGLDVT